MACSAPVGWRRFHPYLLMGAPPSPPPTPPFMWGGHQPYFQFSFPRRYRNSEKRKEKSRDAARCRRGKESEIFTELANALPLPSRTISMLDKASVMRLTIAFLKTRALCHACLTKKCDLDGGKKLDLEMDSLFLKALDGFLLVLSTEGDIIYSSENIAAFLGLPQVDVMGQCLYEYTHPCDHEEARALVSSKGPQEPRHAFLRLKCTLTAKGRSVNLKSASYKVVRVSGELVRGEDDAWLVALGTPVPHPSNIEFPLDKQTFVSKHSLDMKFTYVDDNVSEFCGYVGDELMGRSLYEMHHALDTDLIKDAYKTLRIKGQVETGRYRFLARDGGYVWVVTQATLIHGPKDHKPQYVVCLNYVVSGVESPGEVLSELQLRCSKSNNTKSTKSQDSAPPVALSVPSVVTHKVLQPKTDIQPKTQVVNGVPARSPASRVVPAQAQATSPAPAAPQPQPPTPVATTSKIFTPRTEEMNKGYLIFPDDQPFGIELKDEPEDLTHLAPSGGDTCVPLEIPIFKPELDDEFTLDFKQIPISHTDVALFTSPTAIPDILEQGSSPEYEEYEVTDRGKTCNRLSGGKTTVNKNGSCSPLSICSSPGSACGLRTPEPPKPLLSQAAVFPSPPGSKLSYRRVVESSRPVSTTESLFTQLNETAHESFTDLELKVENQNMDLDEFDMRAPFIPLSNESLMLNQDDLMWGAHSDPIILPNSLPLGKRNSKYPSLLNGDEDSSLAQLLRDRDPPIAGSGPEKNLESRNPADPHCSQYQQSKFLDGGGSFVDPNQVLPGHFGGKDGDDGAGVGAVEDDPPQVMMHETVEPPPPLINVDSHQQDCISVKRQHSPNSSPLLGHKKLCSLLYEQQHQQHSPLQDQQQHSPRRSPEGSQHQVPQMQLHHSGIRELTTPYAPTMQQLLISKEPITVRGGRPGGGGGGGGGGGISAPLSLHKGKDSVLRNLLNVNGEIEDPSRIGEAKVLTAPVRLTQDRMTAMLLADGSDHLSYPKLRILTGGGGSFMQVGQHSFKTSSGSGKGGGGGGGGGRGRSSGCNDNGSSSAGGGGAEGFIQRGRRQDPLLLVDPDLTIPSLSELSQLDFEVNAPANIGNLLQGADLLMALDQA
ncbi:protein similar-like isoform X5 [Macrobrachium rosenbergii]|uniref:protein similar-like isoform X5 n=1 Tax=Macrobrachium rosenbergii TaxID=79674 RepID=UPI0034D7A761